MPPLPSEADRLALIQGVKTGVIDAIAIDHTPYTYEEKMVGFELAPPGAIGLELALAVLWHELVETHQLTALELWQALSSKPARCLGIAPPQQKIWFAPYTPWTANVWHPYLAIASTAVKLSKAKWSRCNTVQPPICRRKNGTSCSQEFSRK